MGGNSNTISTSETKAEALRLQSSAYGAAIPVVHGKTRIAGNLLDYGNFQAIAHTTTQEAGGKGGGSGPTFENTTYTYTATVLMGLCEGPIQSISAIWAGKVKYTDGRGPWATSLIGIYGNVGQAPWSVLSTLGASHALGYSGMVLFGIQDYDLGNTADVVNHNFELVSRGAFASHVTLPDADAGLILSDWITSTRLGRGLAADLIGSLTELTAWSRASGLMFSPALTEQAPAADRINQLCELVHAAVVPADGKLHFVPLATEPVSRSLTAPGGAVTTYSYTPDVTPLFELGPDQFVADVDEPRVRVTRKTPADVYNVVRVEFRNRGNEYALDVAVAEDRANIDVYGAKPAGNIKADWIHDHQTAQTFARMKLQRYLTQLRQYEFLLPWNFAEILPSNLLLINDPDQGLDQVLVRVERMEEDTEGWRLQCVDCPSVQSAAPIYELPQPVGFVHGYADLPGNTTVKAVFEAPYQLTQTGLEVWAAIEGSTAAWGGAHVWISVDGVNYKRLGSTFGASRSGTLSGAVSGGSLGIQAVSGKVLSGSAADAKAKATLCYIGGSAPEFLSYTTATLVSAGSYTLGGLVRGQYGSSADNNHAAGDTWVRCDDALATSGPLSLDLIGTQVWLKLQSFNVHGLETQDLADVTAVTYTVSGKYARPTTDALNLIPEGSFGPLPLGQRPETWNGGAVVAVTGQPFSRALRFESDEVVETGAKIDARAGDVFWFGGWGLADATSKAGFNVRLKFYSASGALLSTATLATFVWGSDERVRDGITIPAVTLGWHYLTGGAIAPAGADYCVPEAVLSFSNSTPHPLQVAELVLRKQLQTVDVRAGAATGTYSTIIIPSTTITAAEVVANEPDGQLVATLNVTTPVACSVIVTAIAVLSGQNSAGGFSASFGGAVQMGVYSTGFSGSYGSDRQGVSIGPGANVAKTEEVTISDILQLKAGTWPVRLQASKISGDMPTASIRNIRFKVEVIKL